jgi:acetyl esterase/lipase
VAVLSQRLLKEKQKSPKLLLFIYPWTNMAYFNLPYLIRHAKTSIVGGNGMKLNTFASWYVGITNVSKELDLVFEQNEHFALIEFDSERGRIRSYFDMKNIPNIYKRDRAFYELHEREINVPSKISQTSILKSDPALSSSLRKLFDSRLSPILAPESDLVGLPKSYFIILEWDSIKEDGLLYAQRLREASVEVEIAFYENAFHGMVPMIENLLGFQKARDIQADTIKYLKSNL